MSIKEEFLGGMIPRKIDLFPYPTRYCPFCEREVELQEAIHLSEDKHVYKALYLCLNGNCGAYDLESKKAYVKIYYSCNEAYDKLKTNLIKWREITK